MLLLPLPRRQRAAHLFFRRRRRRLRVPAVLEQPVDGGFGVAAGGGVFVQLVIDGGEGAKGEKDVSMSAAADEGGDVEAAVQRRQGVDEAAPRETVESGYQIGAVEKVGKGVGGADGMVERQLAQVLFEGARSLGDRLGVKVFEEALRRDGNGGDGGGG